MDMCTRDAAVERAREWARATVPASPQLAEVMAGRVLLATPPWQPQRLGLARRSWLRLLWQAARRRR